MKWKIQKRPYHKPKLAFNKGSITLEATITVPIVVALVVSIALLIRVVLLHSLMQQGLHHAGTQLSKWSYLFYTTGIENPDFSSESLKDFFQGEGLKEIINEPFVDTFIHHTVQDSKVKVVSPIIKKWMMPAFEAKDAKALDNKLRQFYVVDGIDGLDFSGSRFLEDENDIQILLRYKISLPLPVPILKEFYIVQSFTTRAWMGGEEWIDTKTLDEKTNDETNDKNSDETNDKNNVFVWGQYNHLERGIRIQDAFQRNLPPTFKTIAKFQNGTITGMLSVDPTAPTYQQPKNLKRLIQNKLDSVQEFSGYKLGNVSVEKKQIKKREVLVIFPNPPSLITEATQTVLTELEQYGREKGVILKFEYYGVLKMDDKMDDKMDEKLDEKMDEKMDEKLDGKLDEKMDTKNQENDE